MIATTSVTGMRILITGAGGMIGRKLTARLLDDGELAGRTIEHLDLVDLNAPDVEDHRVTTEAVDLTEKGAALELAARGADVVFHLAGVVSGEAETNLDKGLAVNLDGTRELLDAIRRAPGCPRSQRPARTGLLDRPGSPGCSRIRSRRSARGHLVASVTARR